MALDEPDYKDRRVKIDDLRVQLANLIAKNNVAALLYPHQKRLPVMIGEMNQAERNGILASLTGFPAITVPAGFTTPTDGAPIGVPVGIEFLGPPFSEPQLLQITYGFEQATHARKPPQSTPPQMAVESSSVQGLDRTRVLLSPSQGNLLEFAASELA